MKTEFYKKYVSSGQASEMRRGEFPFSRKAHETVKVLAAKHFPNKDIKIIDLACGNGTFLYSLQKIGYLNTFGVDISNEQIEQAIESGVKNVTCNDLFSFLEASCDIYDVILMIDIIEHFSKDELSHLFSILKCRMNNKSLVLFHVPNAESPFGMRIRYGDFTHEHAFTQSSIRQLLKINGFSRVVCFSDIHPVYNLKSLIQNAIRLAFELLFKLFLFSESGNKRYILSQNLYCIARI